MAHRGFRYRVYPTPEQEALFRQFAGVCRLIYNLALEQRRDWWRQYEAWASRALNDWEKVDVQTGPKPSKRIDYYFQCRELTDLRREFDWIGAVPCNIQQQKLRDVDVAYKNFFAGRAMYPKPHKKGVGDTFRFPAVHCGPLRKINAKWSVIRLPKIGDVRVRTHQELRGKPLSITIGAEAGQWYASWGCEVDEVTPEHNLRPAIGIDRGVVQTLVYSTGAVRRLDRERLSLLDRRARKAARALSRKQKGSRRALKAKVRLGRIKSKTARYRKDWCHKISHDIAARFGVVALEKLNVSGMTRSAKGTVDIPGKNVRQKSGLNRAILDQGWNLFEVILGYKMRDHGGKVVFVAPPLHIADLLVVPVR